MATTTGKKSTRRPKASRSAEREAFGRRVLFLPVVVATVFPSSLLAGARNIAPCARGRFRDDYWATDCTPSTDANRASTGA